MLCFLICKCRHVITPFIHLEDKVVMVKWGQRCRKHFEKIKQNADKELLIRWSLHCRSTEPWTSPWNFINLASSCSLPSQLPHCSCSSCWARNRGLFASYLRQRLISGQDPSLGSAAGIQPTTSQPVHPPSRARVLIPTGQPASQPSPRCLTHTWSTGLMMLHIQDQQWRWADPVPF